MGLPIMATAEHTVTDSAGAWADLSGRWFFSWRMAAACETALREVHFAMDRQRDPNRMEALDMIVERLPQQPA